MVSGYQQPRTEVGALVNYFIRQYYYYQDQPDWNDCKTLRYAGAPADILVFLTWLGVWGPETREREKKEVVCVL